MSGGVKTHMRGELIGEGPPTSRPAPSHWVCPVSEKTATAPGLPDPPPWAEDGKLMMALTLSVALRPTG